MTAARGVVVGYDGSPSSEVALTWAIEEARRSGLPLTLVHTAEVDLAVYGTGVGGGDWAYARSDVVGDSDSVTRAKEALGEDLVTVHRTLGNAARHLVEASHDADLVVTGTPRAWAPDVGPARVHRVCRCGARTLPRRRGAGPAAWADAAGPARRRPPGRRRRRRPRAIRCRTGGGCRGRRAVGRSAARRTGPRISRLHSHDRQRWGHGRGV
ncbi:hypothetical protein BN11_650026 [Nostocoides australiense Ben110]|uniref:UspA domain-containing protein n=1 Tax=Nostocoides australiense Ben110 TaxID=1193182 RepID=W6K0C1_9MICO|nr:hypothetical protein BN11_650026 [Tetrasphaera australiensis Ben110]